MVNKIRLICIGKVKERYIIEGINEYRKRLNSFVKLEIIELKENKSDLEIIEKYQNQNTFILDANGKEYTSEEFSILLKKTEPEMTFIIGGPEGFSIELKKKFKLISLSKMTFIHEMCQLFLLEQIYRGFMIINKRDYYNK